MENAHCLKHLIHPGSAKTYHEFKQYYCWSRMKSDILEFFSKCNCQQVKYEHNRLVILTKRMLVPEWKWERINMEFIVLVKVNYNAKKLEKIYIQEILRLHSMPISIILDRGTQFTLHF